MTAYHGLITMARLQKGEKVLIHSAAGSTGQMAIWLAKMVDAEIFATVGYESKKQLLIDEFDIPADHIFYSRDTSFSQGLKRMTNGVNVVLNSLSGEGLRASLPMACFAGNISFFALPVFRSLQRIVVDLLSRGALQYPRPLHLYPIFEIEKAFRYLQSGKNTGRIIVTAKRSDMVSEDPWKFDANATYLIVGGLSGLGRAIIKWMADKGAKYLILPSRSGLSPSAKAAVEVVSELQARGVQVVTPKCDASSATSLSAVIEECSKTMPAVKGCINASMALQDTVFDNMNYPQWTTTIRSKINTIAQSNYATGCTFQDAIARQCASMGERAASFDIGWMGTIGIVSETKAYQRNRENSGDMAAIGDGLKERADIVVQAVTARLARALSVSPDDVEPNKLLSDYGLRNWMRGDFQANVAVFDIMGETTIAGLGKMVIERAEISKGSSPRD
ncbi:KR domain-containing protein [Hypoxylon sp. NC1633]|nr:KR domain-containing protein [Hypoxylon sp. NC1633]